VSLPGEGKRKEGRLTRKKAHPFLNRQGEKIDGVSDFGTPGPLTQEPKKKEKDSLRERGDMNLFDRPREGERVNDDLHPKGKENWAETFEGEGTRDQGRPTTGFSHRPSGKTTRGIHGEKEEKNHEK